MSMCGDSRTWDLGTGGHDKQTSPDFCTDFCAEFVKYNFRQSSERQYMLESLSTDQ